MICYTFSKADVLSLGLFDRSSSTRFVRPRKNIFRHSYTHVLLVHPAPYNTFTSCSISFLVLPHAIKTRIILRISTSVNIANGSSILTAMYFPLLWRYQLEIFTVCPRTQKLNFPRFLRACDRISSCYVCFPVTFGMPLITVYFMVQWLPAGVVTNHNLLYSFSTEYYIT